jgi:hypothetical protein
VRGKVYGSAVRIAIVHVPGCPNVDRLRARLRDALAGLGVEASVRQVEVDTGDAAARAGLAGSPTILIDGRDPFPGESDAGSLSCRLYRTGDDVDGAPSMGQLMEALSR